MNEPSPREAETAEAFVQRLNRASDGQDTPGEWGRVLGQLAREQRNPFPSLQLAIRQLGDAYLVRIEKQRLQSQLTSISQRRELHEQTHRAAWLAWLTEQEQAMQHSNPEGYARLQTQRQGKRAELADDPTPWARKALDHFDTDSARLHAFREFFGLPDFWQWDARINSQSFSTNT